MFSSTIFTAVIAASAGLVSAMPKKRGVVSMTPHVEYSSSIGVLGCKINTNRVAYWPMDVDCENLCVKITNPENGESLHVLRIDSSTGAYDISYDAYNVLITGKSAKDDPAQGNPTNFEYEEAPIQACIDDGILPDGTLPLSAANSMNYYTACAGKWAGDNAVLYNIADPICTLGKDEKCTMPPPDVSNQADCPSGLGSAETLPESYAVENIPIPVPA